MKAFKCDCCDKYFDYKDSHIQAKTKGNVNEFGVATQYDLCPACSAEFMDWIYYKSIGVDSTLKTEKTFSFPKQANENQKED